jgi:DNA mismatch repair ATPase MutS
MRRATASSSVSRRRRQQEEEDDTHSAAPITQNSQQQQQQHGPPPMGSCMICTTVVQEGSLLAFACYDEERNEILLETCITENGIDCIERFLEVAKPNLLLLSNKILQNEILLQVLTSSSSEESEEAQSSSTPYRLLKSSTFDIRGCKARILQNLRVLSLSSGYDGHDGAAEQAPGFRDGRAFPVSTERFNKRRPSAYHSLAALIDFDCKPQIQAVGSLVSFLQESVFRLAEDEGFVTVDRIVLAKSHDFMRINASTLSSLHIFSTEHHPLLASKGRGNSKEGWSLFSLLDRTKSKGGRKLLKDWMLRPLIDLEAIQERQNAVELFLQPTFQTYAGILLSLLGKIGPIDSILLKMTKCSTQSNNFLTLAKALVAALSISATLTNDILPRLQQDCSFAYLTQIASSCHADVLLTLQERIATVIDDQATLNSSAVVIRRGFHPQLDKWKDQYEDLDGTSDWMCLQHITELLKVAPSDFSLYFQSCWKMLPKTTILVSHTSRTCQSSLCLR